MSRTLPKLRARSLLQLDYQSFCYEEAVIQRYIVPQQNLLVPSTRVGGEWGSHDHQNFSVREVLCHRGTHARLFFRLLLAVFQESHEGTCTTDLWKKLGAARHQQAPHKIKHICLKMCALMVELGIIQVLDFPSICILHLIILIVISQNVVVFFVLSPAGVSRYVVRIKYHIGVTLAWHCDGHKAPFHHPSPQLVQEGAKIAGGRTCTPRCNVAASECWSMGSDAVNWMRIEACPAAPYLPSFGES